MAEEAVAHGIGNDPGEGATADARSTTANGPPARKLAYLVLLPALLLGGLGAGGYVLGLFAAPPAQDLVPANAPAEAPIPTTGKSLLPCSSV